MELVKSISIVVSYIFCFVLIAKAIYHTYYVLTNLIGKHSGKLGFIVLFMPGQFNKIGNQHRVYLIETIIALFICSVILVLLGAE